MSADLQTAIEEAWERRAELTPADREIDDLVDAALDLLDDGEMRVAQPNDDGSWTVNQWLKKAVLLSRFATLSYSMLRTLRSFVSTNHSACSQPAT